MVKELSRYSYCNGDKTLVTIACDTVWEGEDEEDESELPLTSYTTNISIPFSRMNTESPVTLAVFAIARIMPFGRLASTNRNGVFLLSTSIPYNYPIERQEISYRDVNYEAHIRRVNSCGINIIGGKSMGIKSSILHSSIVNNLKHQVKKEVINYIKEEIANRFYKEYYFSFSDTKVYGVVIQKFLKKYDKKFSERATLTPSGEVISNRRYAFKISKSTYVYVESGYKITSIENRFIRGESSLDQDIRLFIIGERWKRVAKYLDKQIVDSFKFKDLGIFTVDAPMDSQDPYRVYSLNVTYSILKPRSIDTLFYSNGEKEKIINHINKFLENKDFYEEKQLLYKTGILLYGSPGTGKSSLVKAIATEYSRSIAAINVSNIGGIDLNKLAQSINADSKKYIILLEDIDTLFLNRDEEDSKEERDVINRLLQFLDSNTSPNDAIIVATTNHKERLDEALLREGRFDLKVEIAPLNDKESWEFGKSFGLNIDEAKKLVSDIHKEFPDKKYINQALLQTRILAKIENRSMESAEKLYGVN